MMPVLIRLRENLKESPSIRKYLLFLKHRLDAFKKDTTKYKRTVSISKKHLNARHMFYVSENTKILNEAFSIKLDSVRNRIQSGEYAKFEVLSVVGDAMGKALRKDGEYYRGIYQKSIDDFFAIWNTGIYHALWNNGLIPELQITNLYSDDFPLILKVKTVPISDWSMWSDDMVKDACILIARLKNILNAVDCTLYDGHLNNITFVENRPMLVDIGSIVRIQESGFEEECIRSGCFHLAGLILNNSFLSRINTLESTNNMLWIFPDINMTQTLEYRYIVKKFKKLHILRGNHLSRKIVHKLFDLNILEPEYVELLFAFPGVFEIVKEDLINKLVEIILELNNVTSVLEIGRSHGSLGNKLYETSRFLKIQYIDCFESNVDAAYRYKTLNSYVINYMYPVREDILQILRSDIVVCYYPLNESGAFQPIRVSNIILNLKKYTKKYIVIVDDRKMSINKLIHSDNLELIRKEFRRALSNEYEIFKDIELEEGVSILVGKMWDDKSC